MSSTDSETPPPRRRDPTPERVARASSARTMGPTVTFFPDTAEVKRWRETLESAGTVRMADENMVFTHEGDHYVRLQPRTTPTMFLPMSWTSPFTVAITTVPL